jgi:hypothetical protein
MEPKEKQDLEKALKNIQNEIEKNGLSTIPEEGTKMTEAKKAPRKKAAKKAEAATEETTAAPKTKKKAAPKGPAVTGGTYGSSDLALELGVSPADVRKGLRVTKAVKPENGWKWAKKTDPALTPIRAALKAYFKELNAAPAKEKAKAPAKKKAAAKKEPVKKTAAKKKAPAKKKAS